MLAPTLQSLLAVKDLIAVAVFAITGALVASRKEMDVVGFLWLGIITGVGGGTVRDLLLGVPVFWMREPLYVVTSVAMSVAVYFTAHLRGQCAASGVTHRMYRHRPVPGSERDWIGTGGEIWLAR